MAKSVSPEECWFEWEIFVSKNCFRRSVASGAVNDQKLDGAKALEQVEANNIANS